MHYNPFAYIRSEKDIGFSPDMFDFDNLLGDVGVILDNAVMNFKE